MADRIAIIDNPISAVLEQAKRFEGQKEVGHNAGPAVTFFNLYVIGKPTKFPNGYIGAPWCGSYVITCMRLGLGAACPIPVSAAYANVDHIAGWAKANNVFLTDKPQAGDIFLVRNWKHRNKTPTDWKHTGFVLGVRPDGTIDTIEGNTNKAGSREGRYCMRRVRKPTADLDYVRWVDTLPIT